MKTFLKRCVILFALLLCVVLISNAVLIVVTGSWLETEIAKVQAADPPVYMIDFKATPVPPAENAAIYLRRATLDLEAVDKELNQVYANPDFLSTPLSPADVAAVEKTLQAYPHVLTRIDEMLACTKFNAELDFSQGPALLLPHVNTLRSVARLQAVRAWMLHQQGKPDEAVRQALSIFRLGQFLDNEPLLISFLVATACRNMALHTVHGMMQQGELPPAVRDEVDEALKRCDSLDSFQQALIFERAFGNQCYEMIRTNKLTLAEVTGSGSGLEHVGSWWVMRAYLNDDQAHYLEIMNQLIAVADKDPQTFDQVGQQIENAAQQKSVRFALSSMLLPSLMKSRQAASRVQALSRSLLVLNAIQRRAQAGEDVSQLRLEDIKLPDPYTTDPFNNLPLRLKKTADGWVVYSVGTNLKDDGGELEPSKSHDIGWAPIPGKKVEQKEKE